MSRMPNRVRDKGPSSSPEFRATLTMEDDVDRTLENELILLLASLEQFRWRLDDRQVQRQPAVALETLTEMVNTVVAFAESRLNADADGDSLAKVLAQVGDVYTSALFLQTQLKRSSVRAVLDLFLSRATDSAGNRQLFGQIAHSIIEVLQNYFALFEGHLQTPLAAARWADTYSVFLQDLRQVAGRIQF